MRRSDSANKLAVGLLLAAVFWSVSRAQADNRPRHRSFGPGLYREPGPRYLHRYYGPTTTYGSPYYGLANRAYFAPPPVYGPYGYGAVVGYGYPRPYDGPTYYAPSYGGPYAASRAPSSPYFDPNSNPVLQESMLENQLRWGLNLPPSVTPLRHRVRLHPSTPEQQAKSIHAQAQGDVWMRRLKFLNAYERYKHAVSVANDRPEPYFRLGYALAAVGSYDSAVKYIKQGLELDPQWPSHGERLETIFGDDNRLAILSLTERVTGWVREDIRDPDRLFLVGVLLHFNGDNRASQFFEAAYRLAGGGDHLMAFLQPQPPAETRDNVAAPGQPAARAGQNNGTAPPPAPAEPPLPLEQIPGAALTPPGATRPSPPSMPRRISPSNPSPNNPRRPPARPVPALPPSKPAPQASPAPAPSVPPSPALPLPPLPAAAEPSPDAQSNSQSPTDGPLLVPETGNSTATRSP